MGCLGSMILRTVCAFACAAVCAVVFALLFPQLPEGVGIFATVVGFVGGFYIPRRRKK